MAKSPVLSGGPYHLHVIVIETEPKVLRFSTEPERNIHGGLSICAPTPTPNGEVIYRRGQKNAMGNMVYHFVES